MTVDKRTMHTPDLTRPNIDRIAELFPQVITESRDAEGNVTRADDFAESSADYLQRSSQKSDTGDRLVANTEANGRFHSDWLSMMYSRLKLARSLLTDDGVLIAAIGDHEHGNLRLLLDQVMGSEN